MKKIFLFLIMMLFPLSVIAKVNVVATLPVFGALAQEVGGDRVEVVSLARGNQDPHFLDAKPSFVIKLNEANMLVHGGLELEIGWLPPILVQARNPKINENTPGNVDLSRGISVLEIPQKADRSMGDVHPRGNPHSWLDPSNAKIMAVNIAQHLSEIDPEGKAAYEANLKSFVSRLNQKIAQWQKEIASVRGEQVVTYHKSLSYFANWTGLEVVGTVEPKPGIPPSSRYVDELIDKMKNKQVRAILVESFYPKKYPEYLSQKTGVPLLSLPTDVGEEGIKTYIDLIDHLINQVKGTLK